LPTSTSDAVDETVPAHLQTFSDPATGVRTHERAPRFLARGFALVIELAILILLGAGTYAAVVLAFRPRTLRTFWVLVPEK
jgi:hypothetical protein